MAVSRTVLTVVTAALALVVLGINIWNLVIAADDHPVACDEHIRIYWDLTFAASAVAIVLALGVLLQLYYVFRAVAYPVYLTHWGIWSTLGWLYILATAIVGEIYYNDYNCGPSLMNDMRKSLDIVWATFAAGVVTVVLNHLYAHTTVFGSRRTVSAPAVAPATNTAGVQPYSAQSGSYSA